ncbi:MAG: twin-arginine translocase TatA/TatE family subunit [Sandaracinaceae bacterium]|nr:twin-arginine translocase TatA/TatE family subunit [Sandaracinaceae bacterium]
MGNISAMNLIVILAILFLLFGAKRLPELGESVGKAVRNLKRGLSTDDDINVTGADTPRVAEKNAPAETAREAIEEAEVVDRKS